MLRTTTTVRPVDVVIAGAQRAGSTSLVRYLGEHPDIGIHEAIEFPYFVVDHVHRLGYPAAYDRFYGAATEPVLLAKSAGVLHRARAVERAVAHNPAVRFVVVLRDPAARAISAYQLARLGGQEPLDDVVAALGAPADRVPDDEERQWACSYVERSRYAGPLRRLAAAVGWDDVLPLRFDDLVSDPEGTCRRVFEFMGVDPDRAHPDYGVAHNPTGRPRSAALGHLLRLRNPSSSGGALLRRVVPARARGRLVQGLLDLNRRTTDAPPPVPAAARRLVVDRCRDDVVELEELLGWDLTAWKQA